MAGTEKQKQSLYFPDETLREIMKEAVRLDRSLSWTVQQAWRVAREQVRNFPSADRRRDAAPELVVSPMREPQASGQGNVDLDRRRPSAQVREFLRGKFDRELTG
ncbi:MULTISPECIES: TIGR04563 family protein [Anaeromyxobacter]|uniref:TIGR04563 family protein n=1 Tax=Anaeromyxobacter TaxID=161492 RepID=UPI001F57BB5E|nr:MULTISPECIES: TIGR04563 family protein [unclassified Anaeromyxobacter]